jgi:fumarylacetoacetate (FAA) hydrolase
MKLGTIKSKSRDGELVVVSDNLAKAVRVSHIVSSLREAIEQWEIVKAPLENVYGRLNKGNFDDAFDFDPLQACAPMPRCFQWLDGSAFLNHGELMVRAFNLAARPDFTIPLLYQGASDDFIGPCDDVVLPSEDDGIDFEGEYAVVVDEVPMGTRAEQAEKHIKLVMLVNDVSLRAFGPREMASGFGFIHAKPSTAFGPVAVTTEELGDSWQNGRLQLNLDVYLNGEKVGSPNGGEMHFDFCQLIEHATRTRRLKAGTIIGSGTLSNKDRSTGSATLAEKRAIEVIAEGSVKTSFMSFGDRVRMEVLGTNGRTVFGAIDQKIVQYAASPSER